MIKMYFSFVNSSYLYFLFLIPILIFFHFYNLKNIRKKAIIFANFEAIARIKGIDIYSKNIIVLSLNVLMVFTLTFSLAGLTLHKEMDASSFSFIIAIDASGSMGATDLHPNRLAAARETSSDFVDALPLNSKAGIISFAGNSYIEQDLTDNKQKLKSAIENIELTEFGGTDIYEAVSISSTLLKNEENKAIVLLSDGQINVGNMYDVVEYARDNKVLVHTFGIGTLEGGKASFGLSKMDEDSLKSLAYNTDGKFFNISTKEDLKESFSQVIPLTKKMGSIDLSFYFLITTIIIFIAQQFLIEFTEISI